MLPAEGLCTNAHLPGGRHEWGRGAEAPESWRRLKLQMGGGGERKGFRGFLKEMALSTPQRTQKPVLETQQNGCEQDGEVWRAGQVSPCGRPP